MAIKPWVGFGGGFSFDADSLSYAVEVQIRPGSACSNDAPTETLNKGTGTWSRRVGGVHQLAWP
ncbi:hypothetical protein RKD37_000151 [Streptomyces ambofaciens]|jgi:hypothetical protein